MDIEVEFLAEKVELYATAPAWAKIGFTAKKKAELQTLVETVLRESDFIAAS
ncbi:hypothetical protein [Chenggangzhangella methanolivorans]|uniref:hypothetical protein n=1 Tax=Chenggangzhangella methanolivorans TaxID=1437009 RepID=UPI0021BD0FE2|nr:hypothetical protein [Chenggangzhangella methanolivorans]